MNKERRKALEKAIDVLTAAQEKLDYAKEIIDGVKDEEEEALDALPDGIRDGERGEAMQDNIDSLDEVASEIEIASDSVSEQIDVMLEVINR